MSKISAGLDIGSRTIKLCLMENEDIIFAEKLPTTVDPISQCQKILSGHNYDGIVATGYGRSLFSEKFHNSKVVTITEIQAFSLGAHYLYPQTRTILDIGGQDTKAISVDSGLVKRFEMNDRCAAGTGKFLEIIAVSMQIPLEEFGGYALRADKKISIASMCTVFAESEVTSLVARGEKAENIALGVHRSVLSRTTAMLARVGIQLPLLFAGGVARNLCMGKLLKEYMKSDIIIPENPDLTGAIGAALYGSKL